MWEFCRDYLGPAIALLNDANRLNHLSKPLPEYGGARTSVFGQQQMFAVYVTSRSCPDSTSYTKPRI
jgi:hypothetical protein